MSRIYKPPTNKFTIEGDVIRVAPGSEVHKVSGTSMGGILGVSPFATPFTVACNLLGVASEDISDKPAVKVGIALEGKIIDYADKTYPSVGAFFPAEKIFEKRAGDHNSWTSDFEDDTFAGHVDGIVMSDDGDYILEVKTSANMDSWADGVPRYYQLQVALYNYFITKRDLAYVVLGKVNENTYGDYHTWIANENTVALFEMPIDQEMFEETLDTVREWYSKYILNGVTPPYDPDNPMDVEMFNHLQNIAGDIEEKKRLVNEYRMTRYEIDSHEADIKDKYDYLETLKAQLKDYMVANRLSELTFDEEDESGAKVGPKVVIVTQNRKGLDELAMEKDGIDLTKYRTIKQVTSLKLKE